MEIDAAAVAPRGVDTHDSKHGATRLLDGARDTSGRGAHGLHHLRQPRRGVRARARDVAGGAAAGRALQRPRGAAAAARHAGGGGHPRDLLRRGPQRRALPRRAGRARRRRPRGRLPRLAPRGVGGARRRARARAARARPRRARRAHRVPPARRRPDRAQRRRCSRSSASATARPPASTPSRLGDLAVLPFRWPLLDAYFYLPHFAALRRANGDPEEPMPPAALRDAVLGALDEHVRGDGHLVLLFHPFLLRRSPRRCRSSPRCSRASASSRAPATCAACAWTRPPCPCLG